MITEIKLPIRDLEDKIQECREGGRDYVLLRIETGEIKLGKEIPNESI